MGNDHFLEFLKKVLRISGACGCFRMVLNSHDRFLRMTEAFQSAVVQIDETSFYSSRRNDAESVVL